MRISLFHKLYSLSWNIAFFIPVLRTILMLLIINGKKHENLTCRTLTELIRELDIRAPRFAIALNCQVIPKSQHETTAVKDGDTIEIVQAVGGG